MHDCRHVTPGFNPASFPVEWDIYIQVTTRKTSKNHTTSLQSITRNILEWVEVRQRIPTTSMRP